VQQRKVQTRTTQQRLSRALCNIPPRNRESADCLALPAGYCPLAIARGYRPWQPGLASFRNKINLTALLSALSPALP
jgi:hypothetical protein